MGVEKPGSINEGELWWLWEKMIWNEQWSMDSEEWCKKQSMNQNGEISLILFHS